MKFFIPIDRTTIRYDPKISGPYVVPCKITYEQVNGIRTIGDTVENGIVIGESKIHYLGSITVNKDYQETARYAPYPEYKYEYEELLVQCQEEGCWKTEWWSSCPLYEFYDSFHNEHYNDGLSRACLWCNQLLELEFEKLDRPTLEKYAAQNSESV